MLDGYVQIQVNEHLNVVDLDEWIRDAKQIDLDPYFRRQRALKPSDCDMTHFRRYITLLHQNVRRATSIGTPALNEFVTRLSTSTAMQTWLRILSVMLIIGYATIKHLSDHLNIMLDLEF
jgi:hypothetical protein